MSAARSERLLNLLTLLLNTRRPLSFREIRELDEFEAYRTKAPKSGERAFERDKAALVELGVPLRWISPDREDDEEGAGGYVVDRERYYLPDLRLTPGEMALLSVAGTAALALPELPFREALIRALAKVGFDLPEGTPHSPFPPTPMKKSGGSELSAHLALLHEAVADRRAVFLSYERRDGAPSERVIEPWGVYHRRGAWYVVGHCRLRDAERTFHVGRIRDARLAEPERPAPQFDVPASFDLHEHSQRRPWAFPNEAPTNVVLRLAPHLLPAREEIFGPEARIERRDDEILVHLVVRDRDAFIATILPFGANAEVLEPPALRRRIGDIYAELCERYEAGRMEEIG